LKCSSNFPSAAAAAAAAVIRALTTVRLFFIDLLHQTVFTLKGFWWL
jgi:hypothetical protein